MIRRGSRLIYLPETDFDMDTFLADVERIYKETGSCMVAVSEGIHYADGSFVSEAKTSATNGFGHAQARRPRRAAGEHREGKDRREGARH